MVAHLGPLPANQELRYRIRGSEAARRPLPSSDPVDIRAREAYRSSRRPTGIARVAAARTAVVKAPVTAVWPVCRPVATGARKPENEYHRFP